VEGIGSLWYLEGRLAGGTVNFLEYRQWLAVAAFGVPPEGQGGGP